VQQIHFVDAGDGEREAVSLLVIGANGLTLLFFMLAVVLEIRNAFMKVYR
jgi:hypothetical protein